MRETPISVYVVSLIDSERRDYISNQLAKFNLPFEFFNAIHGASSDHPVLTHYDEKKRILRKNYPLLPGELGCFASHYLLWEMCVDSNRPFLILEDDARPTEGFRTILEHWDELVALDGIVKLFGGPQKKFKVISTLSDEFQIVKYFKRTRGTAAYIVTPKAAQRLLKGAQSWVDPVDDYMDSEWVHNAQLFSVYPYCFVQPNLGSTITHGTKPKSPLYLKLRREIVNIPRAMSELWYKIKLVLR